MFGWAKTRIVTIDLVDCDDSQFNLGGSKPYNVGISMKLIAGALAPVPLSVPVKAMM